jgi:hypothetical protein
MPSVPPLQNLYSRLKYMNMNDKPRNPRLELMREVAVLQLKLVADGFRDALLIPVSLLAGLMGLVRGGEEPDREFRRVLKLGRRSERWINLFGQQRPLGKSHPAGSLDVVLEQVETTVMEQYRKGRTPAEARTAIKEVLDKVQKSEEPVRREE